eukprot:3913003-Lingulodinium_polyedra.AAC.1
MSGHQSFTWLSKRGHPARIDFVLRPMSAQLEKAGTFVGDTFDLAGGSVDHFPVFSTVSIVCLQAVGAPIRRPPI